MTDTAIAGFLDCGVLESGFARVRCGDCSHDFLVREEILEPVGHASWTFSIPRILRPYFLFHWELLDGSCPAAWSTVAAAQTFGDRLNRDPHVRALVSRGGWRRDERRVPVPFVDPGMA